MTTNETHKRIMAAIKTDPRPRRVSRRAAIREAKIEALQGAINRVRGHRRNIPRDWERGFNAALTQIEIYLDEIRGE